MEIREPLIITSRLAPGVKIGDATISIEYADITPDGRQAYRWFIDNGNGHRQDFRGEDLVSGVGGGSLQEGLKSLLGFLGAFAEAIAYQERIYAGEPLENSDLFPVMLSEWATANADEISMLAYELEEKPGEFIIE
ncbi:MAG: hypothetical protein NWE89_13790 [Candidatus Bathyarchaeota archaeon]|nr:hypothetical protein [Candidatus Bathyarchaeota archaeon]